MKINDVFEYAVLENIMDDAEYNRNRYPTAQHLFDFAEASDKFEKQRLKLLSQEGDLHRVSEGIRLMLNALGELELANALTSVDFFSEEYLDFDFKRHKRAESVRKARLLSQAKKSKRKSR